MSGLPGHEPDRISGTLRRRGQAATRAHAADRNSEHLERPHELAETAVAVTTYVAFLRAVNVGGNNRVPMAPLRDALTAAGLEDVSTVLQSGNVVFRSGTSAEASSRRSSARRSRRPSGSQIGVVVRSAGGARGRRRHEPVPRRGPRPRPEDAPRRVPLRRGRRAAAVAKLDPDRSPPDAFVVHGREVYLSYPDGSGRSRLTLALPRADARRHGHRAQLAHGAAARDAARLRDRTDGSHRYRQWQLAR